MDRSTVTAALKPLERRGLVATAPDPDDRRGRRVALTPAGVDLMIAALPLWQAEHDTLDEGLDAEALRCGLAALDARGRLR
jgi:DNA-binding MarR family transcriptional regulator